ncbi:MAG TPA: aldolase/citrate lyase family protein [Gemmatimonadales bacterium]|nr:aldolase/citrate lyase family protein [Gemmatimonadales bacterium]
MDHPCGRRVLEAWEAGRSARNAWLTIPDPYLAEIVAARGPVEAVTLDLQHGLFDRRSAVNALRSIAVHGAAPLVRMPDLDPALIGYLLDAGAAGLIAPMVESASEVTDLVAACRYPPSGRRSYGPNRSGLAQGFNAFAAAEQALLFAMIETRAGLEQAEDIAAVEGVTGLFIGPGDLGLSLGIGPGQDREEPEIQDALIRIRDACQQAGKRCAVHANGARYAARIAGQGYDLVTVWVDVVAISSSLADAERAWTAATRPTLD